MLNIDASIHRIVSYADAMGWSAERYAAKAEIPASTARDVLKRRGNPTTETLRAMERIIPARFRATKPRSQSHSHHGATA